MKNIKNNLKFIFESDISIGQIIGDGAFGQVYKGKLNSSQTVAIKVFSLSCSINSSFI